MSHERVVDHRVERYDVYIGRGPDPEKPATQQTRNWGNRFMITIHGDRAEVCRKYKEYVLQRPWMVVAAREELKGQVLGCWCAPRECHGDFLATLADSEPSLHEPTACECSGDYECYSCKGLFVCTLCGSVEGATTTECPRVQMTQEQIDAVYDGKLNYIYGQWVEGVLDEAGRQTMPCWAGRTYVRREK